DPRLPLSRRWFDRRIVVLVLCVNRERQRQEPECQYDSAPTHMRLLLRANVALDYADASTADRRDSLEFPDVFIRFCGFPIDGARGRASRAQRTNDAGVLKYEI